MKTLTQTAAILLAATLPTTAQLIIADDYNVASAGSGFVFDAGLNAGINPPTTRLTGSAAAGIYYRNATSAAKPDTSYSIGGSARMRIASGGSSGRINLTSDGTTSHNFGSALGIGNGSPVVYDVTVTMDNNSTISQRMSFAIATTDGGTGVWDFGLQLYRAGTDGFYTVQKRIDTASSGFADMDAVMFTMPTKAAGSEVSFLIRVTDAGAETTTFGSRVQVSYDDGQSWAYDTASDSSLENGFRFDTAARHFLWDIAPNDGPVTYDNFSVRLVPEPSSAVLGLFGLAALLIRRRR